MKPRISLVTLGVDDLERALAFYRDGLGLPTEGIVGQEYTDGAVPPSAPSPTDFAIAHNVRSRQEVDRVLTRAASAGGVLVKQGRDTAWGGYAGYFQDPDGHLSSQAAKERFLETYASTRPRYAC